MSTQEIMFSCQQDKTKAHLAWSSREEGVRYIRISKSNYIFNHIQNVVG